MFMCSVLVWHVSGRLALCLFYINAKVNAKRYVELSFAD